MSPTNLATYFRMTDFTQLIQQTLDGIAEVIDEHCADLADAEFQGDVLVITLNDRKQYVVNRNIVHRQLWLSSPVSGAWHFTYDDAQDRWVSTRGAEQLHEILTQEFSSLTGHEVRF